MFSNVHDLSRFVIAFMNGGKIDGREALKPAAIAKLAEPHATIPGGTESYTYGLQVAKRANLTLMTHSGARAGYGSTIMMAPSRRVAAIVLGNRSGSGLPRTARRAMEILLRVPEGALAVQAETPEHAERAGSHDLNAWAGRYSQGRGTVIEILANQQGLLVRGGGRERPAKAQGQFRLLVGGEDGSPANTLVLVPDGNGRPAYVFTGGRAFRRIP
jgi:CubicO group peptidase (beta-lactamase class C family)